MSCMCSVLCVCCIAPNKPARTNRQIWGTTNSLCTWTLAGWHRRSFQTRTSLQSPVALAPLLGWQPNRFHAPETRKYIPIPSPGKSRCMNVFAAKWILSRTTWLVHQNSWVYSAQKKVMTKDERTKLQFEFTFSFILNFKTSLRHAVNMVLHVPPQPVNR